MRRILLCSMAVPWPDKPRLCAFHHDQARALAELGAEMRLFSPAPLLPVGLRHLSNRAQGHARRPRQYVMNGVRTESPRCAFVFPPLVRHGLAVRFPGAVAAWATGAVAPSLRRAIEQFEPDMLLGHGTMPWGSLLGRMQGDTGIPFALIEHSAGDVTRLAVGSRLERHCTEVARRARQVFVVGSHMRQHLQRLGWGNVCQLVNGARWPRASQLLQRRPVEFEGRTLVLSAGSHYRRKGFEELVDGFAQVAATRPDAVLVVITDASRALAARVRSVGLGSRIRILPTMDQQDLLQWMVWADLFALPSWSEAFGLVYAEALASGTPVLMSSDCGLAGELSLARHNPDAAQHGWLVEPQCSDAVGFALRDALSDPARLAAMGAAGREHVRDRYTWRRNAAAILAALDAAAVPAGQGVSLAKTGEELLCR